jgi:galactose mutarotase-like enzyme
MKHPFNQSELQSFVDRGESILVQYRNAASICWSHGTGEYIASPLPRKVSGLPFTIRGRIHAITPENFDKMLKLNPNPSNTTPIETL